MSFFGLKTSKEVEREKREAAEQAVRQAEEDAIKAEQKVEQRNRTSLKNLSLGSQIKFCIPYFDVFDSDIPKLGVPVAIHGSVVYSIDNLELFQSKNKLERYSDDVLEEKLRGTLTKIIKGVVINAPTELHIPLVHLEQKIVELSEAAESIVAPQVEKSFGIKVRNINITRINIDKTSRGFRELNAMTNDLEKERIMAKHKAEISNISFQNSLNQNIQARQQELIMSNQEELQRMNLENQSEMMRIQREEMQRASRLQTEQTFLDAHQANLNAGVVDSTPNVKRTSRSRANRIPMNIPPMPGAETKAVEPNVQYMLGINGQQSGPYTWQQLQLLVQQGQLTTQTLVWTQGMSQWVYAGQVSELQPLFGVASMPGIPPLPNE
jgi:ribosomal protein L23